MRFDEFAIIISLGCIGFMIAVTQRLNVSVHTRNTPCWPTAFPRSVVLIRPNKVLFS